MTPFVFTTPATVNQALEKKSGNTQFIGGGTNLLDLMKKNIAEPEQLLNITNVLPNIIKATGNGISIGAMVRNSTITTDATILSQYPLVAKAILAGASPQIRHMASTGGNLLQRTRCPYFYDTTLPCNKRNPGSGCSAINGESRMSAIAGWSEQCVAVHPSDLCIALAALDAVVMITDKNKKTAAIPFNNFHRLPGTSPDKDNNLPANAIITSIDIAKNPFAKNCAYIKLRDRDSYAFALVSVAAALHLNGDTITAARLASGGVAHKPWRWTAAEIFLKGKKATPDNFAQAAAIAAKQTKPLAGNAFKVEMLKGVMQTALQNCLTT